MLVRDGNLIFEMAQYRNVDVLPLPAKKGHKIQPAPPVSKSPEPEIDYFDYQG